MTVNIEFLPGDYAYYLVFTADNEGLGDYTYDECFIHIDKVKVEDVILSTYIDGVYAPLYELSGDIEAREEELFHSFAEALKAANKEMAKINGKTD